MAKFYELTEVEVKFLIQLLTDWREQSYTETDEAIRAYLNLKHYLETRQRSVK